MKFVPILSLLAEKSSRACGNSNLLPQTGMVKLPNGGKEDEISYVEPG